VALVQNPGQPHPQSNFISLVYLFVNICKAKISSETNQHWKINASLAKGAFASLMLESKKWSHLLLPTSHSGCFIPAAKQPAHKYTP